MSVQRAAGCPPAVEVERHSVGEQSPWRTHIEGCAACGAHVRELQAASSAFAKQRPTDLFLKQLERRRERQPARHGWLFAVIGALAAAALAIGIVPRLLTPEDDVRLKGGGVEVYFKRGEAKPVQLVDGARVKPGDTLGFRYHGGRPAHLAILELDRAGSVTVFAPFGGTHSVGVNGTGDVLAGAVVLDETPGTSRLFIIEAQTQFELAPLVEALGAQRDPKCEGCRVEVLRFEKVP